MNEQSLPHSPLGTGAAFFFGPPGAPAGFSQPDLGASFVPQDIFVGCKQDENATWSLLPAFTARLGKLEPLVRGRYGRFLAWSGDKWMIGPLVFKICTPFTLEGPHDEPFDYAPVVCGYLEYDNSHSSETAELLFGISGEATRIDSANALGWRFGSSCGFATAPSDEASTVHGDAVFGVNVGPLSALQFAVPPHSKRIVSLVLGWHSAEIFASRWFADVQSVLAYGLDHHGRYIALSDQRDMEFMRSSLSLADKARVATETRTWLASTRRRTSDPEIDLSPLRQIAAEVRSTSI